MGMQLPRAVIQMKTAIVPRTQVVRMLFAWVAGHGNRLSPVHGSLALRCHELLFMVTEHYHYKEHHALGKAESMKGNKILHWINTTLQLILTKTEEIWKLFSNDLHRAVLSKFLGSLIKSYLHDTQDT